MENVKKSVKNHPKHPETVKKTFNRYDEFGENHPKHGQKTYETGENRQKTKTNQNTLKLLKNKQKLGKKCSKAAILIPSFVINL